MRDALQKVLAFHKKLDISHIRPLSKETPTESTDLVLRLAAIQLDMQAQVLEGMIKNGCDDRRILRAHLLLEELGELCDAMSRCDEFNALDAIADLQYVLCGAALTMDLPLIEAFDEVHASNMTKEKQSEDAAKDRVRSKGPNYRPPNLAKILFRHRNSGHILLVCDNCKARDSQPPDHHPTPPCSEGCGARMREATIEEYILEVER